MLPATCDAESWEDIVFKSDQNERSQSFHWRGVNQSINVFCLKQTFYGRIGAN